MDKDFLKIVGIQHRIDRNRDMEMAIKGIAAAVVFATFLCGVLGPYRDTLLIVWFISLPIIVGLFLVEVQFIKQSKEYEYEIYRLEVEAQRFKKELVKIRGEMFTDAELNRKIEPPTRRIELPVTYYIVLLILDFLILMLILSRFS